MKHRKYRGRPIENTEGFNSIDDPNALAWDGKEEFLRELREVEAVHASVINYNSGSEFHCKGWRWPTDLAYRIRVNNIKPRDAFRAMIKQEYKNV